GKSEDLWATRVDLLGERAELEKSDGDTKRALDSINRAIEESKEHGDDERLWLNTYSRSNIHFSLADAKRETYVNLPCDTKLTWPGCKALAEEVRNHLSEALNDTVQAVEITRKLGHDAFAQSFASETPAIEKERQVFEVLVATKQAAYIAHQAEPAN